MDAQSYSLDISSSYSTQDHSVAILEQWVHSSRGAVGTPPTSLSTNTHERSVQAQSEGLYGTLPQLSFAPSDIAGRSFNLPDTDLYPNSPDYMENQIYSQSAMDVMPYTSFDSSSPPESVPPAKDPLNKSESLWAWGDVDQPVSRASAPSSADIARSAAANSQNSTNYFSSIDSESTSREHPLYQKATTGPDGLYHCPWEGKDPSCNHKPEKLKCNYE